MISGIKITKIRIFFPIIIGITLLIFLWPHSPQKNFRLIKEVGGISEYELTSNSLRILLVKAPYPDLVAIASIYDAGSRQDEPEQFGTAHFLEHITFRGSKKFNSGLRNSIPDSLQQIGAMINAQTSNDVTTYFEIIPNNQMDTALSIEADRMRNALISDSDVERESLVITNEYENLKNNSKIELDNAVWGAAFRRHPYRYPIIGYLESIQNMTPDTLKWFYNRYYQPNHLTLAVIGEFDENRTLALIHKHYGHIPPSADSKLSVIAEPIQSRAERITLKKSNTENRVQIAHKSPPGIHADLPALILLSKILTGGTSSRLHQALIQSGLALRVESEVSQLRDPGLFIVSALLSQSNTHEQVEKIILQSYDSIKTSSVTADELESAKNQLIADNLFSRDHPVGFIHEMIDAVGVGDWSHHITRLKQLESVSVSDVLRVARQYLISNQSTTGYLISESTLIGSSLPATSILAQEVKTLEPNEKATPPLRNQTKKLPAITKFQLSDSAPPSFEQIKLNGASLVIANTGPRGIVYLKGSLKGAGRFYDPNPVISDLTARLLSMSTIGFDNSGVSRELEKIGSQTNFESGALRLTFSGKCLTDGSGETLKLLIKQLRDPNFDARVFELIKHQLRSSIFQELNSTETQASSHLSRTIYPVNHPLHEPSSNEKLDWLDKTSLADVQRFYSSHFGPNQLSLVLVGDIDLKRIKSLLEEALSGWPAAHVKLRPIAAASLPRISQPDHLSIPSAANTEVIFGRTVMIDRQHSDFPALQMANFMLGGSSSGVLFQKIRQEHGLAYQTRSFLAGFNERLQGYWEIQMAVNSDSRPQAVETLKNELSKFRKIRISADELRKKKMELLTLYRIRLSSSEGLADQLLLQHESGFGPEEIRMMIKKIDRLKAKDVEAAIRRYFHPEEFKIVTAGKG